jgi:hypothetical protein
VGSRPAGHLRVRGGHARTPFRPTPPRQMWSPVVPIWGHGHPCGCGKSTFYSGELQLDQSEPFPATPDACHFVFCSCIHDIHVIFSGWCCQLNHVRLAYQPLASSTFISEQTSHQQPDSSTFVSEQTSTSHQPNEQAACSIGHKVVSSVT